MGAKREMIETRRQASRTQGGKKLVLLGEVPVVALVILQHHVNEGAGHEYDDGREQDGEQESSERNHAQEASIDHFQGKLDLARWAGGPADDAEAAASDDVGGQPEIHFVEDIEELGPKLKDSEFAVSPMAKGGILRSRPCQNRGSRDREICCGQVYRNGRGLGRSRRGRCAVLTASAPRGQRRSAG